MAVLSASYADGQTVHGTDLNTWMTAIDSSGFTSTATAAGTTVLAASSNQIQVFTGSTTQTVTLPTTSIPAGSLWWIINQSTGAVTVNASGGSTVTTLTPNTSALLVAASATPTTPSGWTPLFFGSRVYTPETVTVSSASTLTLANTSSTYVFSGSTTTWTLPALSGNTGVMFMLENRGSGNITLNPAGSDHIWFKASVSTMTIAAGGSLQLINDGTYWNALSLDLVNNAVGILGTGNGGTGQSSLTSLALTTPTVTGYTETVNALGTVTSSKTIPALSNGTVLTATLTASTACTFTMPTATAGQSFVLLLKQAATTGGGTATFTSVKWNTSGTPTQTSTAATMDIYTFVSDGSDWYGSYSQGYVP